MCKDQCDEDQFIYISGKEHICVDQCPDNAKFYTKQFRQCVNSCSSNMYKEVGSKAGTIYYECVSYCPLYELTTDGRKCVENCSIEYDYVDDGRCADSCPYGYDTVNTWLDTGRSTCITNASNCKYI